MNGFIQDLRYGFRTLTKSPAFTVVAVLTLALGIGVNSSIFSLINAVLLRPLPFKDPDRLISIWERRDSSNDANLPISGHEFVAWRDQASSVDKMAMIRGDGLILTGAGDPSSVSVLRVSSDFFSVLGVSPILGRTFLPEEDQQTNRIAVLNAAVWKSRFGSDPEIIGKGLMLNDQQYTVVGVMAHRCIGSWLNADPDVWLPIDLPDEIRKVGEHGNNVIGRLKPGVSLDQAQTELAQVAKALEQAYPNNNVGHRVRILTIKEASVASVQLALLVLFGAVGFVLLIACANVANLLLTRAAGRQKEIAIRTALGASRLRLIRQTLTESCLLSLIGGGVGVLLALWIIDLLPLLTAVNIPRIEEIGIDRGVLAVTIGLSLLTGFITGLAPAIRSTRLSISQGLNDGTRTSSNQGRRRIGSLLVIIEVALALVLLVGGGLMLRSFVKLVDVDPGFDPHNVLRLDLALPAPRYAKPERMRNFYSELLERLRSIPGVETVGATTQTPLRPGDNWSYFSIGGRPAPAPGQETAAAMRTVSSDYFRAMRIPLKKGRYFTETDARIALPVMRWYDQQPYPEHYNDPQPAPAIIINETMVRMYFPNEEPLGQRMRIIASPWLTIVGVVGDVLHQGLNTKPNPEMYLFDLQEPQDSMAVMVRTRVNPLSLASVAREQVLSVDPDQPVAITTMDQIFSISVGGQRFNTLLISIFAGLALSMAVIGVFGVINYSVAQRTHEIGIRVALGAQRKDILRLVVGEGLILSLAGVAVGLGGAFALTRLIAELLFGVSPTDPLTFSAVAILLTSVAVLASYIPARRAMKVDPMVALRRE
ncbi:MAG TPA: ABC transporter permease [Blastocatellia bacterium]|nr:ABC transporter permease [Blastocatellia bacterium]